MTLNGDSGTSVLSPSKELFDPHSRTNVLDSLESSPASSRRNSLDESAAPKSESLPSRKEIINSIYERMRDYLQEEIVKRSTASPHILKTPGKVELCVRFA